ncbi:hypothetical protein YTPLAS18_19580 [Nitrospira sp.]|nr:hypothetical protein YTPLAS18_19580 [Nitrospira sp.]
MSGKVQEIATLAAWVAGGTLVGLGVGMLYAPRTGSDTRRAIVRHAKRAQIEAIRVGRAVQSGVAEMKKSIVAKHDGQPIGAAA